MEPDIPHEQQGGTGSDGLGISGDLLEGEWTRFVGREATNDDDLMYKDESKVIFTDKLLEFRDAYLEQLNKMLAEATKACGENEEEEEAIITPTDIVEEKAQLDKAIQASMVMISNRPLSISDQPRVTPQIIPSSSIASTDSTDKGKGIVVNEDMYVVMKRKSSF